MTDRYPTYHLDENFRRRLDAFVKEFIARGFEHFSEEFAKIDDFVARAEVEPPDRDAHDLRTRKKERYLLEVVSFRILDELSREAFNRTDDTLIVMPDCLSLHNPDCKKVETKYGTVCHRCVDTCQAHHIVELGRQYRCRAIFSKRKLSEQLEYYAGRSKNLGVIGVACIMMLSDGMRTAADVGVPARGVLLNCTGCEHWNDVPFASNFSMDWLEEVLKEKYGSRN